MDAGKLKQAVVGAIERALDAGELARALEGCAPAATSAESAHAPTAGSMKLLERIVLGDILDDAILSARPQDRTFPLRLFFGELGALLARDGDAADHAFCLASGLNFLFRAELDPEAGMRVAFEVSRQLYDLARVAKLDADMMAKAAPLLAALMSQGLERVKLESVDHAKVFDSQLHERAAGSDATSSRIVRPATFLVRVAANNAVKMKAEVVT